MDDKSTTKNKFDFFQVPDWKYLTEYHDWRPEADPTIPYEYAKQERDFNSAFKNPMGAYTTPEMQMQMQQAGARAIGQDKAQAMRASQYDVNQQRGQQMATIAGLTQPKFAQTESQTKSRPGLLSLAGGFLGGVGSGIGAGLFA